MAVTPAWCKDFEEELTTFQHISTKSSKHGPVAFSEMKILGFEVFGTFQLILAH